MSDDRQMKAMFGSNSSQGTPSGVSWNRSTGVDMSLQDKAPANNRSFKRLVRRFHAARRGNIAIMTAFLMMPIMGLMGLAVDYGNALFVKSRLDQAAQAAATAAAATARNMMQSLDRTVAGFDQNARDADAAREGNAVGGNIFGAQFGTLNNGVANTPTVSVKRVGNTFTATVTYSASLNTYFARMFGVNSFNLTGTRSIIVGMVDATATAAAKSNNVIDEKWISANSAVQFSDPTKPVINDWYSGTRGTVSPLSSTGGPTINGAASASMRVGNPSATIAPILSKKVYLPAGNYELRYWYKSTIAYPDYEPVFICGSVESEMHWVTSSTTRVLEADPRSASVSGGVRLAQSARAGVYLTPVLGNPQADNNAPVATAFPRPPDLPYNDKTSPFNLRADNSRNRIDICVYSSTWIQRSIPLNITASGYFWLSFVAEPPMSTRTLNGFYLGRVQLCDNKCDVSDPLKNNWPWAANTTLYSDSFEIPSRSNGDTFSLTSNGFTAAAKYERAPDWDAGRYGGEAAGAWDPASFVYEVNSPAKYDGPTSVLSKRLGIWTYRRMLLMPGVYRFSFKAGLTQLLQTMQWCASTITDAGGVSVTTWQFQDTSVSACLCPAGAITTIVTSDERTYGQANANVNNTAPSIYRNTTDASGSAMSDCHASAMVITDRLCVLVPRTQYYGFQFRVSGPYDVTVTGSSGSDPLLGASGAFLDALDVTLLSPGVKNKFTGTPGDPGDFEDYFNQCSSRLGSQSLVATKDNILSGGVPAWPGLAVPAAAYSTPPVRLTVTAPSQ